LETKSSRGTGTVAVAVSETVAGAVTVFRRITVDSQDGYRYTTRNGRGVATGFQPVGGSVCGNAGAATIANSPSARRCDRFLSETPAPQSSAVLCGVGILPALQTPSGKHIVTTQSEIPQ
jgi:hypothetical protein